MPRDLVGKQVGGYRIGEILGTGSASTVYEAEHSSSGRRGVVKVFSAELPRDKSAATRLIGLVERATAARHPNLVEVFDVATLEHKGKRHLCIVMERLTGQSLRQRLASEPSRPLPLSTALQIASDVGAALQALHQQGAAHRSLDSGAVFLCARPEGDVDAEADEQVRLLDLGSAEVRDMVAREARGTSAGAGQEPRGDSRKEDVRALAQLLHEMLGPGAAGTPGLRLRNREVPVRVDAAIRTAIAAAAAGAAKDAGFPTVASFMAAVLGTGESLPVAGAWGADGVSLPLRPRSSSNMGWVVGVLAVVGGLGWWWLHTREPGGPVAVLADMAQVAPGADLLARGDLAKTSAAADINSPADLAGASPQADLLPPSPADLLTSAKPQNQPSPPAQQETAPVGPAKKKRPHRGGPPIPSIRGPVGYTAAVQAAPGAPDQSTSSATAPAAAKAEESPTQPKAEAKPKRPRRTGPPVPPLRLLRP